MAKVSHRVHMNPNFVQVVERMTSVQTYTQKRAQDVKDWAIKIFDSQARRTKPPTYPLYRDSFQVVATSRGWMVVNTDEVAVFVEFGSHPGGGQTRTLGYRPLGRGADAVRTSR